MATTVQAVRDIYVHTSLSDAAIQAAIDVAQLVIDQHLASVPDQVLLDEIHRQLAAHFAVLNEERGELAAQRAGAVEETYARPGNTRVGAGLGLSETRYGRTAIALDPTGALSALGKKSSFFLATGGECWLQ